MGKVLRGGRLAVIIAIWVAAAALAILLVCNSPIYQECVAKSKQNQAGEPKKEGLAGLFRSPGIHCTGEFIERNDKIIGAISAVLVALFTTILGIFTIKLTSATKIAADAASRSARALTESERAHLFARIVRQNTTEVLTSEHGGLQKDAIVPREIEVAFIFSNHGKTPAIIKAICRDVAYWATTPAWDEMLTGNMPVDSLPAETDRIIDPGKATDELKITRTNLRKFQAESIIHGTSYFWFYGRVLYDDVFGASHEHRFIFKRDGHGAFRAFDHPEYSKNT